MSYSRLIILMWLTVWTLAVPLVHVHPEADHQHGQASHFHGGTTHSVFSADLPCEYHVGSQGNTPSAASQSTHKFDHPEIGFSLLTSSPERGSGKPVLGDAIFGATLRLFVRQELKYITHAPVESAISFILPVCLSARAPPASASQI